MRCETSTNRKLRNNTYHETAPASTAPSKSDNFFLQKTNTTAVEFRILLYLAKLEFFNHVASKISVERTCTALQRQWATERDFGIQYNTIQYSTYNTIQFTATQLSLASHTLVTSDIVFQLI
jgi:hypothetical protein